MARTFQVDPQIKSPSRSITPIEEPTCLDPACDLVAMTPTMEAPAQPHQRWEPRFRSGQAIQSGENSIAARLETLFD